MTVLALAAACGGDGDEETAAGAAATQESSEVAAPSPEEAAALDGTWRTRPISVDDMTTTLREQGLAKWIPRFERNPPVPDTPTSLVLVVEDGRWDLYGEPEGGGRDRIDYDAEYEVEGDTVVVSHEEDSNTYRWSVEGEALELIWLETTYPPFEGIPEEVFQRALYMTEDFRRAD